MLVGNCAACGGTFFPKRVDARYCKETECQRRRRKEKAAKKKTT